MTDTTEQQASMPWLAWSPRKTWEEVRVRLRSRDGNEWEELASDFQYWIQSADGQMCDDVVAFQIVGETPLDLASVSSASAEGVAGWIIGSGDGLRWRHWHNGMPEWVESREEATRYARRCDAEAVHCNDEDAWSVTAYTPEPVPATDQAGEVDVTALQERVADLEGELEEALYQPWPKWAEDMKKQIRDVSGYDGYDDATDGVNLPDELSELINELTEQADKNAAEARAARKLDELESSVEHYRNGMNEWIARAQALATQPATSQEGERHHGWTTAGHKWLDAGCPPVAPTPTPPAQTREAKLVAALEPFAAIPLDGHNTPDGYPDPRLWREHLVAARAALSAGSAGQ